jgi:Transglycosylase SLT domain
MFLQPRNGCLFLTLAGAALAVGLQFFVLQSQPDSNRKVSGGDGGTSNTDASSKFGLPARDFDRPGIDVASLPPQREDGRFKSTYAYRNVLGGSPGEMDRGGERVPQRFKSDTNARAGVSSGELGSSGRAAALAPWQREGGQTTSSIEQEPVHTDLNVDGSSMEAGPMDVGPGTRRDQSAETYSLIVARYAPSLRVPESLVRAVIRVESNYQPNARGDAGEIGLMQIKLETARLMGYSGSADGLFEPEINIRFGMKYLASAYQLSGGQTCQTILRYNAGHGAKRMNPVSAALCSKVKQALAAS